MVTWYSQKLAREATVKGTTRAVFKLNPSLEMGSDLLTAVIAPTKRVQIAPAMRTPFQVERRRLGVMLWQWWDFWDHSLTLSIWFCVRVWPVITAPWSIIETYKSVRYSWDDWERLGHIKNVISMSICGFPLRNLTCVWLNRHTRLHLSPYQSWLRFFPPLIDFQSILNSSTPSRSFSVLCASGMVSEHNPCAWKILWLDAFVTGALDRKIKLVLAYIAVSRRASTVDRLTQDLWRAI